MKKFNSYITKSALLAIFFLASTSCENFLDVNEDADQPSSATPNLLLTPIQGLMAINCYEQGETTAYFAQHVATLSGWYAVKDRWDYTQVTRVGLFRRHFHDVASNAKNLIETARAEGSRNYEGVGHVMMVLSTQTATDLFGQMPYLEALKGNPSPPYDNQEVIYNGILEEIDEAIALLEASDETDRLMGNNEDSMYGGDMNAWLGFAHGLKARLLLHLTPNINQDYNSIIAEVDAALATWEDPEFQYIISSSDWEMNQWGPSRARPEWDYITNILNVSAPTPFMVEEVMGYDPITMTVNDPRMPLMMIGDSVVVGLDTLVQYLTVIPSEGKESTRQDDEYPDLYNTYYTSDDSAQPYMTEEELMFIKAEAAFQNNDPSTAYTAFVNGITIHMERVGVDPADIATFLAGTMVPADAASLELSDIMTQKWLALYLQAEAWVDMRRHHYATNVYPGIQRPANLSSYWTPGDNSEWIQRLPYDNQTEEIYNKPELERLGAYQNPDWLKVPLWWTGNLDEL
ncbi:MAG: SusD/RagB family nutrient-binding outer membrane lipoprotein [Bacteroidota bacterium]